MADIPSFDEAFKATRKRAYPVPPLPPVSAPSPPLPPPPPPPPAAPALTNNRIGDLIEELLAHAMRKPDTAVFPEYTQGECFDGLAVLTVLPAQEMVTGKITASNDKRRRALARRGVEEETQSAAACVDRAWITEYLRTPLGSGELACVQGDGCLSLTIPVEGGERPRRPLRAFLTPDEECRARASGKPLAASCFLCAVYTAHALYVRALSGERVLAPELSISRFYVISGRRGEWAADRCLPLVEGCGLPGPMLRMDIADWRWRKPPTGASANEPWVMRDLRELF